MGADIFRKFVDGVMKAQRLFGNSNFEFTDEQWKKLYSAFAKMYPSKDGGIKKLW